MNHSPFRLSVLLAVAAALSLSNGACKGKDGSSEASSSGSSAPAAAPKGPLVTKAYDQLVIADLASAVTGLGWTPGQTSHSESGPMSNIQQTARKTGETKQLVVAVFKMPAANLAQWKTYNTDYATDVQGSTVLAVKLTPTDPDLAKKLLSQITGK